MMITDYLFTLLAFLFVHIVGNHHIQHFFTAGKLCKLIQDLPIGRIRHPVIAVHHFKIQPGGIFDTGVDR